MMGSRTRRVLAANAAKSAREQLTLIRVFEELRGRGYDGGYDAVRRYARRWSKERGQSTAAAYVPLSFAPGEAYQFDWSHDVVLLNGVTVIVKAAHAFRDQILLCRCVPYTCFLPRGSRGKREQSLLCLSGPVLQNENCGGPLDLGLGLASRAKSLARSAQPRENEGGSLFRVFHQTPHQRQEAPKKISIIDVFAGPGGLSEGFHSAESSGCGVKFASVLSIGEDPVACETLRLRSFYHQFTSRSVPEVYYKVLH
jgi:hypothetical protein